MVINLKTKLEKEYDDLNNEKEELEISLGLKQGLTKKQQEKEKVNELVNKLNQIERNIESERDNRTRMGLINQKKVIEEQLKELNYEPKKSGGRRKLKSYK